MNADRKPLDRKIYDHYENNGCGNLFSFAFLIGTFVFFNGCLNDCKDELSRVRTELYTYKVNYSSCLDEKMMIDSKWRDCLNGKGFITSEECLSLITDRLSEIDRQNIFDCVDSYQ